MHTRVQNETVNEHVYRPKQKRNEMNCNDFERLSNLFYSVSIICSTFHRCIRFAAHFFFQSKLIRPFAIICVEWRLSWFPRIFSMKTIFVLVVGGNFVGWVRLMGTVSGSMTKFVGFDAFQLLISSNGQREMWKVESDGAANVNGKNRFSMRYWRRSHRMHRVYGKCSDWSTGVTNQQLFSRAFNTMKHSFHRRCY